MKKGKLIFTLFYTMLKIGLFTFGGGYGMIALLENEFVSKRKWLTKDEFLDMIAIAESSPGPIAINSSTYIGYKKAGFWGALLATIGVCIPSFVIIFVISLFLDAFLSLTYVAYAFKGIQVGVSFLILLAGIKLLKDVKKNVLSIILIVATFGCMIGFSLFAVSFSAIFYILIGGCCGLFVFVANNIIQKQKARKNATALAQENQTADLSKVKTKYSKEIASIEKTCKEENENIEKLLNNADSSLDKKEEEK